MKHMTKLVLASAITASLLGGCSSSDDDDSSNPGTTDPQTKTYTETFKAFSIEVQVEELMGGVIGIADEVGNGKIGDPLGEDLGSADTTLVESQFSWNSTMDFYNNIVSIQNVWNGGLKAIAEASQPAAAATITTNIEEALQLLIDISDADLDGQLDTADLIAEDGLYAFRQQISDDTGRAKIEAAQTKLSELQANLETLKGSIAPTDSELPLAATVVDDVIVMGYNDLGVESTKLVASLKALTASPTAATVESARVQWRATRAPWESGEGHIFGPVDTLGVDPKVDSWPVDKSQLDGALGGYDPDLADVDGFPVTMKGFHAMEYLLFGDGNTLESSAAAAARLQTTLGDDDTAEDKVRLNYLEDLGVSFDKDIQSLVEAW